jgi:hypothetical protein
VPFDGRITDDDRPVHVSPREGLELAGDPRYLRHRPSSSIAPRSTAKNWNEMRDALLGFMRTKRRAARPGRRHHHRRFVARPCRWDGASAKWCRSSTTGVLLADPP